MFTIFNPLDYVTICTKQLVDILSNTIKHVRVVSAHALETSYFAAPAAMDMIDLQSARIVKPAPLTFSTKSYQKRRSIFGIFHPSSSFAFSIEQPRHRINPFQISHPCFLPPLTTRILPVMFPNNCKILSSPLGPIRAAKLFLPFWILKWHEVKSETIQTNRKPKLDTPKWRTP